MNSLNNKDDLRNFIINNTGDFAIQKNSASRFARNHGVIFTKGPSGQEAYIISPFVFVRYRDMIDVDFDPAKPMFNYQVGEWTENTTSFPGNEGISSLRHYLIDMDKSLKETIRLPISNILNLYNHLFGTEGQRNTSRTIIHINDGHYYSGETIVRALDNGDLINDSIENAYFIPSKESPLKHHDVVPGKYYVVELFKDADSIVQEPGRTFIHCKLKREYYKATVDFMVHILSDTSVYTKTEDEVSDISKYEKDQYIRIPFILPAPYGGYENKRPIHIETPALFHIVNMMSEYEYVDMSIADRLKPIRFSSVIGEREKKLGLPLIEVYVGALDPDNIGWYL